MTKVRRFLGMISGTSADGIDTAIIELSDNSMTVSTTKTWPLHSTLREEIIALSQPTDNELVRCSQLDRQLGEAFATAALKTIELAKLSPGDISAIGSHGQTLRHFPPVRGSAGDIVETGTTLQIGDPNIIAHRTGIKTVADFRRMDMAGGGQGAPLAPLFHQQCFAHPDKVRIILNVGGIANVTLLQAKAPVTGFDTGPGNGLMDAWCYQHRGEPYDKNGAWGASGSPIPDLIQACLADPYFQQAAPKSTGREYFHLAWLAERYPALNTLAPADVQRSLMIVTAQSIAEAIHAVTDQGDVYLCGGGALNQPLCTLLTQKLGAQFQVAPLSELGVDGDFVEAATFAWLAERRLSEAPISLQALTGSSSDCLLGAIYQSG